jgi:putative SOS response-associated peptidase YedK
MCNRYALSKKQERVIIQVYGALELYFLERFNIAPTQSAPVVLIENGKPVCREMKWGFTPRGSKSPVTNAQFEKLAENRSSKKRSRHAAAWFRPAGFTSGRIFTGGSSPFCF